MVNNVINGNEPLILPEETTGISGHFLCKNKRNWEEHDEIIKYLNNIDRSN